MFHSMRMQPLAGLVLGAALALVAGRTAGVTGASGAEWFTDYTVAAGIDFIHFNGMSGNFDFAEIFAPGVALLDFDNDGDLDVYFPQGRSLDAGAGAEDAAGVTGEPFPLTDRLYRNDLVVHADGSRTLRFTDVTAGSGLEAPGYGMGAATGDFDNDGRIDLYLTRLGSNRMLRNNGDGTFSDVTSRTGTGHARWGLSASFLDFDRDGWLDLYVGNYVDHRSGGDADCSTPTGARNYCGPQRYLPVPDRLYRNRGDGSFHDVTAESQIASAHGRALGVVAEDFDGDGWVDLYVANDGDENQLWINRRDGTFGDEALLAGVALNHAGMAEAGMGVDAGDFDNDGDADLFVTHLDNETNTLYVNDGSGMFEDRSARALLAAPSLPYTGFGVRWFDADNDGWLDLLAVNGAVSILQPLVQAGDPFPLHQRNQLFRNRGDGRFEDVREHARAVFRPSEVSRGAAFGDLDNDGDVDVVIGNNNGPARLLLNEVGNRNHWLGLRLVGGLPPRDMLGARVGIFRHAHRPLWRRVGSDGSYASASDPRVLVGLGRTPAVQRVEVIWPSGRAEEWTDMAADRWFTLTEGTGRSLR